MTTLPGEIPVPVPVSAPEPVPVPEPVPAERGSACSVPLQRSPVAPAGAAVPDWRSLPAAQQPDWPDPAALGRAVAALQERAPLVTAAACASLRDRLGSVARGEAFLVQGGDCAEPLDDADPTAPPRTADTLREVATVLGHAMSLPVVVVGRMAGQYAKPRSSPVETRDGVALPSYRGDAVNAHAFTPQARVPDPGRLLRMHDASAATLEALAAAAGARGGAHPALLALEAVRDFAARSPLREGYRALAGRLTPVRELRGPEPLFVSHEALLLDYEAALTRFDAGTGTHWAGSGHLLWIGERTRQPDGAHLAYAAGIANPLAVKIGPKAGADDVLRIVERLDPDREPGRLTLIARMGAGTVRDALPDLVAKVRAEGMTPAWISDPMHGNTVTAPGGLKTRRFGDVLDELAGFFEVMHAVGVHPGGVHLEMTGDDVTECTGGGNGLGDEDLPLRNRTLCDPRLNREQALDLAFQLAARLTPRP